MKNYKFQFQISLLVVSFLLLANILFAQSKTKLQPTFANKVVLTEKIQCSAITQAGERCKRKKIDASIYCTQHTKIAIKLKMKYN